MLENIDWDLFNDAWCIPLQWNCVNVGMYFRSFAYMGESVAAVVGEDVGAWRWPRCQCSSGRGGPGESRRVLNRAQRMGCTLTWLLSTLRWFFNLLLNLLTWSYRLFPLRWMWGSSGGPSSCTLHSHPLVSCSGCGSSALVQIFKLAHPGSLFYLQQLQ